MLNVAAAKIGIDLGDNFRMRQLRETVRAISSIREVLLLLLLLLTAIRLTPSDSSTVRIYRPTVHRIQRTEHTLYTYKGTVSRTRLC
jgi:ABC-type transport system involved in cytochrome c biogenesis permease subunit